MQFLGYNIYNTHVVSETSSQTQRSDFRHSALYRGDGLQEAYNNNGKF